MKRYVFMIAKRLVMVVLILIFFIGVLPVSAIALSVPGGTLTVDATGMVSDGVNQYSLTDTDEIVSSGDLEIILNNAAPLRIKSIQVAGDLVINGTGTIEVVNSEAASTGVIVSDGGSLVINGGLLSATGDYSGLSVDGSITVDGGKLQGTTINTNAISSGIKAGVKSNGSIFVKNAGELTGYSRTKGSNTYAIYSADVIEVSSGGTLSGDGGTGTNDCSNGVCGKAISASGTNTTITGSGQSKGVTVGGTSDSIITVTSGAKLSGYANIHAVTAGSIFVRDAGSKLYGEAGEWGIQAAKTITVEDNAEVHGVCTILNTTSSEVCGVKANGCDPSTYIGIAVRSGGKVVGAGGYCGVRATHGISVIGDDSMLEGKDGGSAGIFATNNSQEGARCKVYAADGGKISGISEGSAGLYCYYGSIETGQNGTITGTAPYYGIYARVNNITADGGVIKGTSTISSTIAPTVASVYTFTSTAVISAANGGVIWEEYAGTTISFDNITAVSPYDANNISDLANYTWDPDLTVFGTGLLAQRKYDTVQSVTGTRTGTAPAEVIELDGDSTHKITLLGILNRAEVYMVTYSANNGAGNPYSADIESGGTHTVLAADNSLLRYRYSGYIFTGWNTRADNSGKAYAVGDVMQVSENITLYAQWKKITAIQPAAQNPQTGDKDTMFLWGNLLIVSLVMLRVLRGKRHTH